MLTTLLRTVFQIQMFSKKNIVITIGDHGTLFALYSGKTVKKKILIDKLDSDIEKQLKAIFNKNKTAKVSILLDTTEQNYKRKAYPMVKKGDLKQIIKRDLNLDGAKDNLKNFMIFDGQKSLKGSKKSWECLFISASTSKGVSELISFILDIPNQLIGVYMLPIESFNAFKLLEKTINLRGKLSNKRNDIYCFITQTKVGGLRQTIFSNEGIIFTRTLNYNMNDEGAVEKYEHDIYSAFEYLKRLLPDLRISEFDVINVLPQKNLDEIKKITNIELNIINFTPNKAALQAGYPDLLTPNSNYSDLLLSKIFSDSKSKTLKFTTPKILLLNRFFSILQFSYYLNLILVGVFCALTAFTISAHDKRLELADVAEISKFSSIRDLNKIKKKSLEGYQTKDEKMASIERIIDVGKNDEIFGGIKQNFQHIFHDLDFITEFSMILDKISYSIPKPKDQNPSSGKSYEVTFSGEIVNDSGDIEDLFQKFDDLIAEANQKMKGSKIKHSKLPRDIDFNKKYYSMPINFTVTTPIRKNENN